MQRIFAEKRPSKVDIDGKARTAYDIDGVTPDLHTFAGVVHASWVAVGLRDDPGHPVKIRAWLPGRGPVDFTISWSERWSAAVPEPGGLVSFAAHDDTELRCWWDLTAGKAG